MLYRIMSYGIVQCCMCSESAEAPQLFEERGGQALSLLEAVVSQVGGWLCEFAFYVGAIIIIV